MVLSAVTEVSAETSEDGRYLIIYIGDGTTSRKTRVLYKDLNEPYGLPIELIDNQVRVLAAIDHENQESIYFCDPDGNMLDIYWERPNAREIFRRGRKDQDKSITFTREEMD